MPSAYAFGAMYGSLEGIMPFKLYIPFLLKVTTTAPLVPRLLVYAARWMTMREGVVAFQSVANMPELTLSTRVSGDSKG